MLACFLLGAPFPLHGAPRGMILLRPCERLWMIYRIATLWIMASLLAACGGNVPAVVTPASSALRPDKGATALLYVGDLGKAQVDALTYPQGKSQFTLTGFGSVNGLCTDSSGDVWISDGHDGKLIEYGYGSKKVKKTLTDRVSTRRAVRSTRTRATSPRRSSR